MMRWLYLLLLIVAGFLGSAIPAHARKPKPVPYRIDCGLCTANARHAAQLLGGLLDPARFRPADPHDRADRVLRIAVNELHPETPGEVTLEFTSALGESRFNESVQTCAHDTPMLCVQDFAQHLLEILDSTSTEKPE